MWVVQFFDRIVGLADPQIKTDYIGFDEYGWGIRSMGTNDYCSKDLFCCKLSITFCFNLDFGLTE